MYNVLISAMFVRKKSEDLVVAGKLLMEMMARGFLPRKFTYNRVLNGLALTGNQEFGQATHKLFWVFLACFLARRIRKKKDGEISGGAGHEFLTIETYM